MAAGLSPESWAFLALCGVFLGFLTTVFAIEPGFMLTPLLAVMLPRLGIPIETGASVAIGTALALLVPLSIVRLQPLPRAEVRRAALLSPAILAGAFFGASLVLLMPGSWLFAGFVITAMISLMRPSPAMLLTFAVTPPRKPASPFAAMGKSVVSSLFGIGLPLSDGSTSEKAALTLVMALAAMAALLTAPPVCKGCVGFVFMPALLAIGTAFALTAPVWQAFFEVGLSWSPLRPVAVLGATAALLAAPVSLSGTQKTVLAAFTTGVCRATQMDSLQIEANGLRSNDFVFLLSQDLGAWQDVEIVQTPNASFWTGARDTETNCNSTALSAWTAKIEASAPPPKPRRRALSTKTQKL